MTFSERQVVQEERNENIVAVFERICFEREFDGVRITFNSKSLRRVYVFDSFKAIGRVAQNAVRG